MPAVTTSFQRTKLKGSCDTLISLTPWNPQPDYSEELLYWNLPESVLLSSHLPIPCLLGKGDCTQAAATRHHKLQIFIWVSVKINSYETLLYGSFAVCWCELVSVATDCSQVPARCPYRWTKHVKMHYFSKDQNQLLWNFNSIWKVFSPLWPNFWMNTPLYF